MTRVAGSRPLAAQGKRWLGSPISQGERLLQARSRSRLQFAQSEEDERAGGVASTQPATKGSQIQEQETGCSGRSLRGPDGPEGRLLHSPRASGFFSSASCGCSSLPLSLSLSFFFFFFLYRAALAAYGSSKFPGQGSNNRSCTCQPAPQPQ